MGTCETCGNQYENSMIVTIKDQDHVFDCFECAVHALAPRCANCGVAVLGHGVEGESDIYCSAHCARRKGEIGLCDHIYSEPSKIPNLVSLQALRRLIRRPA